MCFVHLANRPVDGFARDLHIAIRLADIEVATPYAPPRSSRGYHTLTWRSHGHSVAAYL